MERGIFGMGKLLPTYTRRLCEAYENNHHFVVHMNGFYVQSANENGIMWTENLQESAIWSAGTAQRICNSLADDGDAFFDPITVDLHIVV